MYFGIKNRTCNAGAQIAAVMTNDMMEIVITVIVIMVMVLR